MTNIKIGNLSSAPISFDLAEEDINLIKGGTTEPIALSFSSKCPIPTKGKCLFDISIMPPPPLTPYIIPA
jgi:hypothetical protein